MQYGALGLRISSPIDLPLGPLPPAPPEEHVLVGARPDLGRLPWQGSDVIARVGDERSGYEIRRTNPGVYLARFKAGVLSVDSTLRQIEVSEDSPTLAHIAVNLGLSIYLMTLGHCVLHAAAFAWNGIAHAIVGCSGAGKSTLSALLSWAGAEIVSDDTLRVDHTGAETLCWGSSRRLRLRPSASTLAELMGASGVRLSIDGRTVIECPHTNKLHHPLASIWFVHSDPSITEARLVPLSPSETLRRGIEGIRIRGLQDRALMQHQLHKVAELGRALPAFEARVPWGPPFRREWGEQLLDETSGLSPSGRGER